MSASFLSHGSCGRKINLRNFPSSKNKEKVTENLDAYNICSSWHRLLRGTVFLHFTDWRGQKTGREVQSLQPKSLHFSVTETKPREMKQFAQDNLVRCRRPDFWLSGLSAVLRGPSPCYQATQSDAQRMMPPSVFCDLFLQRRTFQEFSSLPVSGQGKTLKNLFTICSGSLVFDHS